MNNTRFQTILSVSCWILIFFHLSGCHQTTDQPVMIDIQGHRGCRGLLPENSLIGFQKALELGVHTLELDVVISKDHKVVVSHEPFMNHEIALNLDGTPITEEDEQNYNLYQMNYDSIQQYDCGSKLHPRFPNQKKVVVFKPLLSEVINMAEKMSDQKVRYNIEIKRKPSYDDVYAPKVGTFVHLVLSVIKEHGISDRTNLQAFDLVTLEEIKKQDANMPVALLVDENESIPEKLQQLSYKPAIISPYYKLLNEKMVQHYQKNEYKVIPWTVNTKKDMQELIRWNVDGIITDYPDVLQKLLTP